MRYSLQQVTKRSRITAKDKATRQKGIPHGAKRTRNVPRAVRGCSVAAHEVAKVVEINARRSARASAYPRRLEPPGMCGLHQWGGGPRVRIEKRFFGIGRQNGRKTLKTNAFKNCNGAAAALADWGWRIYKRKEPLYLNVVQVWISKDETSRKGFLRENVRNGMRQSDFFRAA